MRVICLDACYLAKLLCEEPDSRRIAELVADYETVACAAHGRAEVATTLHRKQREGSITPDEHSRATDRLAALVARGNIRWLPLVEAVFGRIERIYGAKSAAIHVRSGDALHLACAVEHGFGIIWSSDRQMQAGARAFGIECKPAEARGEAR